MPLSKKIHEPEQKEKELNSEQRKELNDIWQTVCREQPALPKDFTIETKFNGVMMACKMLSRQDGYAVHMMLVMLLDRPKQLMLPDRPKQLMLLDRPTNSAHTVNNLSAPR